MKSPTEYFISSTRSSIDEDGNFDYEIIYEHEDLPLFFKSKGTITKNFIKQDTLATINGVLVNANKDIYISITKAALNSKASSTLANTGEWDNKKNRWFVLRPDGRKAYYKEDLI